MRCRLCKDLFDIIVAFILLILLSPVLVVVAVVVRISSSGPVFFRQQRVGQYGKPFTMIKFRTMITNDGLNTITMSNDRRITPVGSFLRRWKLDELPGLFNVLKGEMSFVGPRPDVPGYADLLTGNDRRVLELKPGITGPATLKFIREEEILAAVDNPKEYNDTVIFPEKVRINLRYLEKGTMLEDLKIILYTVLRKDDYEL